MPAHAPMTPAQLKAAFEKAGYKVIDEGAYNWVMAAGEDDEPILVPKRGDDVGFDISDKARRVLREAAARAEGLPKPPLPEASIKVNLDDDDKLD